MSQLCIAETIEISPVQRQGRPTARKLNGLTGLRFLASIYIVLRHFGTAGAPASSNILGPYYDGASVCLSMFFALSGFVLGYSYSTRNLQPFRFYASRLSRVCPLYFIALLLTAPNFLLLDVSHLGRGSLQLWASLITTPLFIQAWIPHTALSWNYPAWSVSVEMFFYVLFPFWSRWFKLRSASFLLWLLPLLWMIALLPAVIYCWTNPDHISNLSSHAHPAFLSKEVDGWLGLVLHNPVFHLAEFASGIALSRLFLLKANQWRRYSSFVLWPTLVFLAAFLYFSRMFPYPLLHNGLLLPVSLVLIFCLSLRNSKIEALLGSGLMVVLGEASYAIYILQYPVSLLFKGLVYIVTGVRIVGPFPDVALLAVFALVLCLISVVITKALDRHVHVRSDVFFKRWIESEPGRS